MSDHNYRTPCETRECPACREIKHFPLRQKTCSPECGHTLRKSEPALGKKVEGETHEFSGSQWVIEIPKTDISTPEQLLQHINVDESVWRIDKFVVKKWEVATWDKAEQSVEVEPLYEVKAWLKKNVDLEAAKAEIESLKEDMKQFAPKPMIIPKKSSSGVMVELSIPDLHVGKLGTKRETLYASYDTEIAIDLFQKATAHLIARTSHVDPERYVLVVGSDLIHIDTLQNTTTRGTQQHTDSRFHKIFRATRLMIAETVSQLSLRAGVDVVMVPGNHDTLSTFCLGDSLECFFSKHKNVHIDNTPAHRKYYQWGTVMLLHTHGHNLKPQNIPLLMATEMPMVFGSTTWREAHTGHLHQVSLRETNGVRIRILPSLSGVDAWHSENGYVGNIRSAESYVWDKGEGLIATATYRAPDDSWRSELAA